MDRNLAVAGSLITLGVALRKESVDRNYSARQKKIGRLLSLSARRAWIEILLRLIFVVTVSVALRKESVDRNYWPFC